MNRIKYLFLALFIATPVLATYTPNMGLNLIDDGVTPWGEGVRDNWSIIDSSSAVLPIDLGSDVSGTLPSEHMVSTTAFTNKQNVFTTQNDFQAVTASSVSVSGNVNINSLTANQCVQTGTGGLLTVTGSACSSGSGSASKLGVNQNGTQVTSPTFALNGLSPPFLITSVGAGATAQWTLDFSSVTGRGTQVINLQNSIQTGATFYVSSGTALQFTANRVNASTLSVSGDSFMDNLRVMGSGGIKIDALTSGQCVQTASGGLLSVTGGACGGAPGGNSTEVQYNNGGNFAGTPLQTVGASSITFTTVSSATYVGFSTMSMTSMLFDGNTSSITFSSATFKNLTARGTTPLTLGSGTKEFTATIGFNSLTFNALLNNEFDFYVNSLPVLLVSGSQIQTLLVPFVLSEIASPGVFSGGTTYLWADSTKHWLTMNNGVTSNEYSVIGTSITPTTNNFPMWSGPNTYSLKNYDLFGTTQTWGAGQAMPSKTAAQLQTITPPFVGIPYYCNNCTALRMCISTGTAQGAFSSPVAATTACN